MSCDYCGSQVHVWWDCPKKPAGWKPGRVLPTPKSSVEPPVIDIAAQVAKVAATTPDQVAAAHKENKAKIRAANRKPGKPGKKGSGESGVVASSAATAPTNPSTKATRAKPAKGHAEKTSPQDGVASRPSRRGGRAGSSSTEPKKARGRPKTIDNLKDYKAQKERERRARLKAEKKQK